MRYLAGDPGLIPEIQQSRTAQETIAAEHPVRLFGETLEHETAGKEFRIVRIDIIKAAIDEVMKECIPP